MITDANVFKHCYPAVKSLHTFPHLIIEAGEESKSLTKGEKIWNWLIEKNADRNSVLLMLGGGFICDLGGFAASVYQRGISSMYVPTTLLCMADASIGGKTAINFSGYKNYIGTFHPPEQIHICADFLDTLPLSEILNGWAEMLKHGLIADNAHFDACLTSLKSGNYHPHEDLLKRTVEIKSAVVASDLTEKHDRKKLNAGHTLGHALEEYFILKKGEISHGYAVAAGLIIEANIAQQLGILSKQELSVIAGILPFFPRLKFSTDEIPHIAVFCLKDKKNSEGKIKMVLLREIGQTEIDVEVSIDQIKEGLLSYCNLSNS